jgi:hypothetical protein
MNAFTQDPGEQGGMLRGPRGDQGDPGPKGEKGDPGESILVPIAETMVQQLVEGARWSAESIDTLNKTVADQDKAARRQRKVIAALVVLFMATGSIAGYLLNENLTHPLSNRLTTQAQEQAAEIKALEAYVQQYAQHGCQALELLSSKPVPKPADPASNPSRETTYEFYEAIVRWEQLDGCKTS